ncbi:hypothetical protein JTE90_000718 [Oedothorax gibbosus]|uniref:Uncharacterized protein n=1 Tax=Oedothorax gibbosus TaxID=931172 RepID=A0AAV6UMR1_9ARAC|nr:hypothetical protein JTE90_000718 [Oedothorax gibbosus]
MKVLLLTVLVLLATTCLAAYRGYDQYYPSSYISRYAYGGKYNVPGTYNYGYPQRYAYQEGMRNNRVYYTPPQRQPVISTLPVGLMYQYA